MSNDQEILENATKVLKAQRVAVFIVTYNAQNHIRKVLERIPPWVAEKLAEIYVIDDSSQDSTIETLKSIDWNPRYAPLKVYKTPYNQGYGGNQRLGYLYAIEKNFDIVILLHGDGQYAPEALPHMIAPYATGAQIVFGSRFLTPLGALRGKMPLYKWCGNRVLTLVQNKMLGLELSEMHSGYRSYSTSFLKKIPFTKNSLGFDFDADIIVQAKASQTTIKEIPIPTFYGNETCHVDGIDYALKCIKTALKYRLMQYEIFYDPKFDISALNQPHYTVKNAKTSLHFAIRNLELKKGIRVLDVGGGNGAAVSLYHAQKGAHVVCIDQLNIPTESLGQHSSHTHLTLRSVDLDLPWADQFSDADFDTVFALDVLEHLKSPEQGLREIYNRLHSGKKLYASTGNIGFFILRIMLALGQFNYGRKGILDLTHKRLFTVSSFKRFLENHGFRVEKIEGFGPPIADLSPNTSIFLRKLDSFFHFIAKQYPKLFAYQILIEATRTDSVEDLVTQTYRTQSDS